MQPNQQDPRFQNNQPNPNGYISPTGANIPEYLHMEPINEQKPRSKRKIIIIISGLLLIVFTIFTVSVLYQWSKDTEKRNVYKALEGLVTVKYIERNMKFNSENTKQNLHIVAKTDFSDINKAKSSINYKYVLPGSLIGVNKFSTGVTLDVEQVYLAKDSFFEKFKTSESLQEANDFKLDQWFHISEDSGKFQNDSVIIRSLVNTPVTIPMVGNFTEQMANDYRAILKDLYQVRSVSYEKLSNISTTVYNLKIDNKKLSEAYSNLFNEVSIEMKNESLQTILGYSDLKVWVKNDDKQVIKTIASQESGPDLLEVTYMYPNKLDVIKPDNVMPTPSVR